MNLKFFLIILYAFVLALIFQYFFPNQKIQETTKNDILINIVDDHLIIPNIPQIEIVNYTGTGFRISPCEEISLSIDSLPISDIATKIPTFCESLSVEAGGRTRIPLDSITKIFINNPGKYIFTVKTPLGERTASFMIERPGTLRTFLTSIFYDPIYNLFVGLLIFLPGHSLGWAIVIITIIIRLILLVPQHHMLESQKKLQHIQPKIKALQKKYKDDQSKLGMEMIELYKKEGVNPMGSCLPLLIQMPILIVLYWVISEISDPKNFYHLYSFLSDFDPRLIDSYFFGLHLQEVGGVSGFIFATILGIVQYLQAKLSFAYTGFSPKGEVSPEEKTEEKSEIALDPAVMQKMMLYVFPVMIAISSYFFPLGVGLYWLIGTIFVIGQQWYVNKRKSN